MPAAIRFAALLIGNTSTPALQSAASAIGQQIEVFTAGGSREIDTAFARLAQSQTDALLVGPGPLFNNHRVQIATLAARHSLPAIYTDRVFCEVGGLMSYGSNVIDLARQVGFYTGRIILDLRARRDVGSVFAHFCHVRKSVNATSNVVIRPSADFADYLNFAIKKHICGVFD